jgi:predicted nucleic acid-binding protein
MLKFIGTSEKEVSEEIMSRFVIYQTSSAAALKSANIYKALKSGGKMINELDILIAGICEANDELLITFDNDFKRIADLKVYHF